MRTPLANLFIAVLVLSLAMPPGWAGEVELQDLALPSETKDLRKEVGAVYYSPTSKGKALIPVHFWGEVEKSGLHYIPVDTNLIKGLSLAGGPKSSAELDGIRLTRKLENGNKDLHFDLSDGGDKNAYETALMAGDTVFVPRSHHIENRAYYTSLVGVIATVLSSILLFREIKKGQ